MNQKPEYSPTILGTLPPPKPLPVPPPPPPAPGSLAEAMKVVGEYLDNLTFEQRLNLTREALDLARSITGKGGGQSK